MNRRRPRVAVIGAGIIGSWTALQLGEQGAETVLFEQFPVPHSRGSSHGGSRAFRFLGDPTMDRLDDSFESWRALEAHAGQTLFRRTGLLNFGPPGDAWLQHHMAVLHAADKPCEWLDADTVRARFPVLRYPPGWGAAWDPGGGILFADRCLAATRQRFRSLGGTITVARVRTLEARGPEAFLVETDELRQCFERVVVCAGPWTARLLPELPVALETQAIPVTYWRDESGKCRADRGFPILFNARLTGIYALPACEYPGLVKVLYHGGPVADPDRPHEPDQGPWVARVRHYVQEHLPTLDHREPAVHELCLYTLSPDQQPVIDRLASGIVVGCGFSGSGFKHAPATGKMLALLALDREAELPEGYLLPAYSARRFDAAAGSATM